MRNKKKKVLAIIPAYNEELNIKKVVEDIKKNAPDVDYIVVNDGSTDNTLEVCENNNYNCIDSIINLGLFGAVQMGFKYALENGYDVAIQFDGDGQHQAKYIKNLVNEINNGYNIVIGSRFIGKKREFNIKMIGSILLSLAIKLTTMRTIVDPTSGMRAYDKEVINDYAHDMNNPPEPDTLVYMLKNKRKIKEIMVEMNEREYGESKQLGNVISIIRYMSRMLVSIFFIQSFRR